MPEAALETDMILLSSSMGLASTCCVTHHIITTAEQIANECSDGRVFSYNAAKTRRQAKSEMDPKSTHVVACGQKSQKHHYHTGLLPGKP